MTGSFYERLAAYLSERVVTTDGQPIPANPVSITAVIALLISRGQLTPDEMRREALEKYDVIIPDHYFTKEADK